MRRIISALLLCLYTTAAFAAFAIFQTSNNTSSGTGGAFVQLAIGAGGVVSGISISADGKQFIRTDTAADAGRLSHNVKFTPTTTSASMPVGDLVPGNGGTGTCAVAISASNTSHWYKYFAPAILTNNTTSPPYVYSSTNNGTTWVRTTNQPGGTCNPNDHGGAQIPTSTEFMDVSLADENVVYLGLLSGGIQYTLNAGSTAWNLISTATIPVANGAGSLIKFDPSDATGNTVYIGSNGNGVWKCTAARTAPSCTKLNSAGMPTSFKNLHVDPLGTVWVVDSANANGSGNVLRYLSGAWSSQLTGSYTAVAVDPATTSYVVALVINGNLQYSVNAQAGTPSWTLVQTPPQSHFPTGGFNSVLSTIIPWQQWRADQYLDALNLAFDPSQLHVLYMGNGDGVYKITPPTTGSADIQWNADESAGIENLDLTGGIALVGGGLAFSAQDRPMWATTTPLAYPARYFPNGNNGSQTQIRWGQSLCGNGAANTYAGINLVDGFTYSTAGFTTDFSISGTTGLPGGFAGSGSCAILTSTNWIWNVSVSGLLQPFFTNNSGASWTACTFNLGKTAGGGGWLGMAQDSTAPGTIVLINNGTGSTNGAGATGIWKSTSITACAFTQQSTTLPTGLLSTLIAVPGVPCNFVETYPADVGQVLPNSGNNVFLTTDCGVTVSAGLSKLTSVIAMGFGKANPSNNGFPALYCQCYADDGSGSKFGFFQLDNTDTITTPIVTNLDVAQGGYPAGNLDHLAFVVGDLATYGVIYGGFVGSGGFYRAP